MKECFKTKDTASGRQRCTHSSIALAQELGVGESHETNLVESIGSVRDELAQENFLLGVERVDDNVHQPANFGLELLLSARVFESLTLCFAEAIIAHLHGLSFKSASIGSSSLVSTHSAGGGSVSSSSRIAVNTWCHKHANMLVTILQVCNLRSVDL